MSQYSLQHPDIPYATIFLTTPEYSLYYNILTTSRYFPYHNNPCNTCGTIFPTTFRYSPYRNIPYSNQILPMSQYSLHRRDIPYVTILPTPQRYSICHNITCNSQTFPITQYSLHHLDIPYAAIFPTNPRYSLFHNIHHKNRIFHMSQYSLQPSDISHVTIFLQHLGHSNPYNKQIFPMSEIFLTTRRVHYSLQHQNITPATIFGATPRYSLCDNIPYNTQIFIMP